MMKILHLNLAKIFNNKIYMDGPQIIHISYVIFLNWINFYNGYYFGLSFLKYGPHSYFLLALFFYNLKNGTCK